MKKIIPILVFGMLLLSIVLVSANGNHESEIEEGKKLVESKISCDKLTDEQLETIGEYYMEQMHSGEAHEMMDQMMGGEGSDSLKQMHINMAKSIYCNENIGGMMGYNGMGMMNMMGGNMIGSGIMGNNYYQNPQNNIISQIFFYIILTLLIIVLMLTIILLINKLKNNKKQKGGNRKNERQ